MEKARKAQPSVNEVPSVSAANQLKFQTQTAEAKWAAFVAEHNTAFRLSDHVSDLFKTMLSDSKIAQNFHSKRTKTTSIVKHVLGETSWSEFIDILRRNKFSLIVDESTDCASVKHLCMVARYFDGTKI